MTKETKEERRKRWDIAINAVELPEDTFVTMREALRKYKGDLSVLESAIGALFIGFFLGWKPLFIFHSRTTILKYETILGIKFRDVLPATTDLSDFSQGYRAAEQLGKYWDVVIGKISLGGNRAQTLDVDSLDSEPVP